MSGGDCRTAPATRGLLNIYLYIYIVFTYVTYFKTFLYLLSYKLDGLAPFITYPSPTSSTTLSEFYVRFAREENNHIFIIYIVIYIFIYSFLFHKKNSDTLTPDTGQPPLDMEQLKPRGC